jgi:hypothetical protein
MPSARYLYIRELLKTMYCCNEKFRNNPGGGGPPYVYLILMPKIAGKWVFFHPREWVRPETSDTPAV